MSAVNLIPARLHGQEFLCATHYKLSHDDRYIAPSLKSTFHKDYTPPPYKGKPSPAQPPDPSDFMHQDREKINLQISETGESFPVKKFVPIEKKDKYSSLYKTNFKLDSDKQIDSFHTTHTQYYKPKTRLASASGGSGKNRMESFIPQGDREKAENPISNYRVTYPAHEISLDNTKHPPNRNWDNNIVMGDRQRRFNTTHNVTFTGRVTTPPSYSADHTFSSVPEGDKEKTIVRMSTMKQSYQPKKSEYVSQDSAATYRKLYSTNFTQSDNHGTFDKYLSTQADSYGPIPQDGPKTTRDRDRNSSDIPQGDSDPYRGHQRVNSTITRSHFINPNIQRRVQHVDGSKLRTLSHVEFGNESLASRFYETTCDSTYKPMSVPYSRAFAYPKSSVPLDYYGDEKTSPTTASDFPRHKVRAFRPSQEQLDDLSQTHFNQPLGGERYFGTTQKLHYTPKWISKPLVDAGRQQRSSLPIGTMGKYIEGCHNDWQ